MGTCLICWRKHWEIKKKIQIIHRSGEKRRESWIPWKIDWPAWEVFGRNWLKSSTGEVDWRAAHWEIDFEVGFRVMKEGDEILGLWEKHTREILWDKREMKFSQLKPSKILAVRNPSQYFTRFWDGIVFLNKSVRNPWEKTLFEHVLKFSHNFGTDLRRKFRSVKTVPNPSEKFRQNCIRPKIPSENAVFLVVQFSLFKG